MTDIIKFDQIADKRTSLMAQLVVQNTDIDGNIAIVIGAAHTKELTQILREKNRSFVVFRAQSFNQADEGENRLELYERKLQAIPRDKSWAKLLGVRWKPGPVLGKVWAKTKIELYECAAYMGYWSRAKQVGNTVEEEKYAHLIDRLTYVEVNLATAKIQNNEVLFLSLIDVMENGKLTKKQIWTKSILTRESIPTKRDVQSLLDEARSKLKEKHTTNSKERPDGVVIEKITTDIVAVFSEQQELAQKTMQ